MCQQEADLGETWRETLYMILPGIDNHFTSMTEGVSEGKAVLSSPEARVTEVDPSVLGSFFTPIPFRLCPQGGACVGKHVRVRCHDTCVVYVVADGSNDASEGVRDGGFSGQSDSATGWTKLANGAVKISGLDALGVWRQHFKMDAVKFYQKSGIELFVSKKQFVGQVFVQPAPSVYVAEATYKPPSDNKPGRQFKFHPKDWKTAFGAVPALGTTFQVIQKRESVVVWVGQITVMHLDGHANQPYGRRNPASEAVDGQWQVGDEVSPYEPGEGCSCSSLVGKNFGTGAEPLAWCLGSFHSEIGCTKTGKQTFDRDECKWNCLARMDCVGFSYQGAQRQCRLFGVVAAPTNLQGTDSGVCECQAVKKCLDGNVRISRDSTLAAGQAVKPEIHYQGRWYPVCANGFVDDDEGAKTFCHALGFTGGGTKQVSNEKFASNAMPVGRCAAGEAPTARASSKRDHEYQFFYENSNCFFSGF